MSQVDQDTFYVWEENQYAPVAKIDGMLLRRITLLENQSERLSFLEKLSALFLTFILVFVFIAVVYLIFYQK